MGCRKEIVETDEERIERSVTHVAPGEGSESRWVFGEVVTWPGDGAPPHIQHREDEAFYVVEGEYEFLDEGRTISTGAGSLIYVPKGNLHAHKNVGEKPGTMLVSQTPGGLYERFFEQIGEETKDRSTPPVSNDPSDAEGIAKIAAEYGIEMPPGVDQHSDRQVWK
jgi:mannose-6-phosphate isomerase-like protein (cupin superfamily)